MAKAKKNPGSGGPTLEEETLFWNNGIDLVLGVDEAGRGCLAGPVSAAVLAWRRHCLPSDLPVGIRDSKQLSEKEREANLEPIRAGAWAFGIGFASRAEIDRWNILEATSLAVVRALETALSGLRDRGEDLDPARIAFLSDGKLSLVARGGRFLTQPELRAEFSILPKIFSARRISEKCLIGGDDLSASISAASILAKVSRDREMLRMDAKFPEYEFAAHKGYFTARHKELLKKFGPCPEHRQSFAPVRELLGMDRAGNQAPNRELF